MKLTILFLLATAAWAQTRTVSLSWTNPTGSTGTIIQTANSITGPFTQIACVGTVAGSTCLSGSTASTASYDDTQTVGTTVWYRLLATAPACTPTTPVGTACGTSAPSSVVGTTIPPRPGSITTVVVVVQ